MIQPKLTRLYLVPDGQFVEATIVTLTSQMVNEQIQDGWWNEDCLGARVLERQIDRHWNWNAIDVDFEGRALSSDKVAIVAGADRAVQGAMVISIDPVDSVLEPPGRCLLVERLATAPRNRPQCRSDGAEWLKGVGIELLTWGAWLSRKEGCGGRLLLDASPDFVKWYAKRGLLKLEKQPIVFNGVEYTPMELPVQAAQKLLEQWEQ